MATKYILLFLACVTLTYVLATKSDHKHHGKHSMMKRKSRSIDGEFDTHEKRLEDDHGDPLASKPDLRNLLELHRQRRQDTNDTNDTNKVVPSPNSDGRKVNTAYKTFGPAGSLFIDEQNVTEEEESYALKDKMYTIVHKSLTFTQAAMFCDTILKGRLAVLNLDNDPVNNSLWLADALSEVDPARETYWIGSKKIKGNHSWYDTRQDGVVGPFSTELNEFMVARTNTNNSSEDGRDCYGIARNNHNFPLFVDVACTNLRPFVCERERKETVTKGTTHAGWLKFDKLEYKIFSNLETHHNASAKCFAYDSASQLAVVTNKSVAANLAHYLLVGRPSLENAWVGAHYDHEKKDWVLSSDGTIPSEGLDATEWLGINAKPDGCGLLDRHVVNHTFLVEARCQRMKPYICSRPAQSSLQSFIDYPNAIDEDLRLYLDMEPFYVAKEKCEKNADGKLVQPKTTGQINKYNSLMGENRTTIKHVWIGAIYKFESAAWTYISDGTALVPEMQPFLVLNSTYEDEVERGNLCLNLDRENHKDKLMYGTDCSYPQPYFCSWPLGKMPPEESESSTTPGSSTTQVLETTTPLSKPAGPE